MALPFTSSFKDLDLARKFSLLLFLVFLGGIIVSGIALSSILSRNAQDVISSKALMMMETMNSVRHYTNTQVRPELEGRLVSEFLPETVPAYSAREVFEKLRENRVYSDFFYKEATLNPTNLRDKADGFESDIVQRFRQDGNLSEMRGFRTTPSGDLFYIARPITITAPSCLQCHSTPNVAPASMIERYGAANGFNWKLNEIVGAQIISVPAQQVLKNSRQAFFLIMGTITGLFALATLLVNLWLRRYVARPLKRMAQAAEAVSTGDLDAEFEWNSKDEVGSLAEAFRRMKTSLVMAMKRLDRYRISKRTIETEGRSSEF
jgi:HAMP domain-containing protein